MEVGAVSGTVGSWYRCVDRRGVDGPRDEGDEPDSGDLRGGMIIVNASVPRSGMTIRREGSTGVGGGPGGSVEEFVGTAVVVVFVGDSSAVGS